MTNHHIEPIRRRSRLRGRPSRSIRHLIGLCFRSGKLGYCRRDGALQHIRSMVAKGAARRGEMHAYRCPHCGWWHVGHKRPSWQGKRGTH